MRTSDPAALIAVGHLISDPRPASQATAAVGAIGLVWGVARQTSSVTSAQGSSRSSCPPSVLAGLALFRVPPVTADTLSLHAAEFLVDPRRMLAALVTAGTPVSVIRDALLREAMFTSMPLSLGGLLIGAGAAGTASSQD